MDQGGTTVALRTKARRARGSGIARMLGHDTHWDLTDAMRPEAFHRNGCLHLLGTVLERTGSWAVELTYQLLCLRGSVLIDGRKRPGQTASKGRLDAGYTGIAWDEPDEADDPGGGQ